MKRIRGQRRTRLAPSEGTSLAISFGKWIARKTIKCHVLFRRWPLSLRLFRERELSEIKLTPFPLHTLQTDTLYEMRGSFENYPTGQIRCAQHRDDVIIVLLMIVAEDFDWSPFQGSALFFSRMVLFRLAEIVSEIVDDRYQTNIPRSRWISEFRLRGRRGGTRRCL